MNTVPKYVDIKKLGQQLKCPTCGNTHDKGGWDVPFASEVSVIKGKLGTINSGHFGYRADSPEDFMCLGCSGLFELAALVPDVDAALLAAGPLQAEDSDLPVVREWR